MNTVGLILAGGKSRRLGAHKFQTFLGEKPLLDHVAARLAPQVDEVSVNLPRGCTHDNFTVLKEPEGKQDGPLAGVLLGLNWAKSIGANALVTMPVDVPFFPNDIVAQLVAQLAGQRPICVVKGARRHGLCAVWPAACLPVFSKAYSDDNIRTVNRMLDLLQAREIAFDSVGDEQFFNVNTVEDIEKARHIFLKAKDHE